MSIKDSIDKLNATKTSITDSLSDIKTSLNNKLSPSGGGYFTT